MKLNRMVLLILSFLFVVLVSAAHAAGGNEPVVPEPGDYWAASTPPHGAEGVGQIIESHSLVQLKNIKGQVSAYKRRGRIKRLYGQAFSFGANPEGSAESFLQANIGLFGVDMADLTDRYLQPVMYERDTGKYKFTAVCYSQSKDGIPVFSSRLILLVRNEVEYPLVLVSNDLRNLGGFKPQMGPDRGNSNAGIANARSVSPSLVNFTQPEIVIWAGVDDIIVEPVLAYSFIGDNGTPPGDVSPEKYLFITDATTGEILYIENLIIFVDVQGKVQGKATQGKAAASCELELPEAMPWARVNIGATVAYADASGDFVIPNPGSSPVTVESRLWGRWFKVNNQAGPSSVLSQTVTPPGPANFMHNNPNTSEHVRAEVNGYLQANVVRDFTLVYNPSYPGLQQSEFPVNVNISAYCNAYYDGSSINFFILGGGCDNTAFSSVVHHEYGHHLVAMAGSGQGAYGEGMGDVMPVLILDDPGLAYGFFLNDCSTPLRNANNTMQYPCFGEIHYCGQLLSGCVWSTRNVLSMTNPSTYRDIISNLAVNAMLLHTGTEIEPSITIDYLTLDDDNGNINDGTPHYYEICVGFGAHNMDCPAIGPGHWLIAIDTTGSMQDYGRIDAAKTYAITKVNEILQQNSSNLIALATFAGDPQGNDPPECGDGTQLFTVLQDWTRDEVTLIDLINDITIPVRCWTPLADAACEAADKLLNEVPLNERRLVLITDGGENHSAGECSGQPPGNYPYIHDDPEPNPPWCDHNNDPVGEGWSWHCRVWNTLVGNMVVDVGFFGKMGPVKSRSEGIDEISSKQVTTDEMFFKDLVASTGGTYYDPTAVVFEIPDQCVLAGESFDQFDADNFVTQGTPPYTWTWSPDPPVNLTIIKDAANVFTITYPPGWTGSETITFTVTDATGSTGEDDATFTVDPVPVVGDIPDQMEPFVPFDLDDYLSGIDPSQVTWAASGMIGLVVDIDPVTHVAIVTKTGGFVKPEVITFTALAIACGEVVSDEDEATFIPRPRAKISNHVYERFGYGHWDPPDSIIVDDFCYPYQGINPGDFFEIPVILDNFYLLEPPHVGQLSIGSFELEVEFDYVDLTFYGVERGILLDYRYYDEETEIFWSWEKFSYRLCPCTEPGCLKYKILLFGQAELPDGLLRRGYCLATDPVSPEEYWAEDTAFYHHLDEYGDQVTDTLHFASLVWLKFQVANNELLRDLKLPITFEWDHKLCWDEELEEYYVCQDWDCAENTIGSCDGVDLYVSNDPLQYEPEVCGESQPGGGDIFTILDFIDGGVHICSPCTSFKCVRGDINLNHIAYDPADPVLLSRAIIFGDEVVFWELAEQRCASDVNADGRPVMLADLIYMIRVIQNDAIPYPKLAPSSNVATLIVSHDRISVECASPIGGLLLEFDGAVTPTLLATDMELLSHEGRVLVWSREGHSINAGVSEVLSVTGADLVSVTAVDRESRDLATTITTKVAPLSFALHNAYPNPFNPNTNLSFTLPNAAAYSMKIYNVAGQLVRSYDGMGQAGLNVVIWDGKNSAGNDVSSGVYFYRLVAGQYNAIKKMIMLK
jgi:hypothetical protein